MYRKNMGYYKVLVGVKSMGNGGGENVGIYGSGGGGHIHSAIGDITRQIASCGKRIDGLDSTTEMIHAEPISHPLCHRHSNI